VDEPTPLFATTGFLGISIPFDTSPDGKRFAITTVPPGGKTMDVIVNWDYGLPD